MTVSASEERTSDGLGLCEACFFYREPSEMPVSLLGGNLSGEKEQTSSSSLSLSVSSSSSSKGKKRKRKSSDADNNMNMGERFGARFGLGTGILKDIIKEALCRSSLSSGLSEASSSKGRNAGNGLDARRIRAFNSCWNSVEAASRKILGSQKSVFRQVAEYVTAEKRRSAQLQPLLPCGAVFAGLSMPDNQRNFRDLARSLKTNGTAQHVAVLRSRKCPTVVSVAKEIVAQLVTDTGGHSISSAADAHSVGSASSRKSRHRDSKGPAQKETISSGEALLRHDACFDAALGPNRRMLPLASLEKWFSGQKRGKDNDLVVVVVEDTECFKSEVVEEFLSICAAYHSASYRSLRFLVLLGLSSANMSGVHGFLPRSLTGRMRMRKFYTADSLSSFDHLFRVLFINRVIPIRLGPKTLSWLSDRFLAHDYSIEGFLHALKFILLDHYSSKDLTFLCAEHHEYSLVQKACKTKLSLKNLTQASSSIADMLTETDMSSVNQLPSVKAYFKLPNVVKRQADGGPSSVGTDDSSMTLVSYWLAKQEAHRLTFGVAFELFYRCHKLLLNAQGISRRNLLVATYGLNVYASETAEQLRRSLRFASWESVERVILEWQSIFTDARSDGCGTLFDKDLASVETLLKRVKEAQVPVIEKTPADSSKVHERNAEPASGSSKKPALPKGSHYWSSRKKRQFMLQSAQPRHKVVADDLRIQIVTWFDDFLKCHIRTGIVFPLSEAFYYNEIRNLKKAFGASPRLTITRSLSNPSHYLAERGKDIPIAQRSDACIAFHLFQQCKKSVSLTEWYHAFREVVEKDGMTDHEMLSRFIVATSELQHLGFFKPARKGSENMVRLVHGSV